MLLALAADHPLGPGQVQVRWEPGDEQQAVRRTWTCTTCGAVLSDDDTNTVFR
jgi:hypothetical protein